MDTNKLIRYPFAKFDIWDKRVIFSDQYGGAILMDDELWYPFAYFIDQPNLDIGDNGYEKPTIAFDWYKKIWT